MELEKDQVLQDKQALTTRVGDAEGKASKAESDLAEALASNANLQVQVSGLEASLTQRTEEKDAEIADIAAQACLLAETAFANALDQIVVLFPDLHLDKDVLNVDHEVRDGKIGKPSADGKEFDIVAPLP